MYMTAFFDISDHFSDVSPVFDDGIVNLVIFHGQFVAQWDVIQGHHFRRVL
jgi:hypothetical protein